jgi:hypothetical protein
VLCTVRSKRDSASLFVIQADYALPLINIPLISIDLLKEELILYLTHVPKTE